MATLGIAIRLAATVHVTQVDKAGKPYMLHPMRIMMRLRTDDEELMSIAILHDVVEDSDGEVTISDLRQMGFSERVCLGVDGVTKRDGEEYEPFIKRCSMNPDSRLVKLEDLRDNSDITRLKGLRPKDFDRMEKYHRAFVYLSDPIHSAQITP